MKSIIKFNIIFIETYELLSMITIYIYRQQILRKKSSENI